MLKTLKKEIAAINQKLMAKESLKDDDVKLVHEGQDFFETFDKLTPS